MSKKSANQNKLNIDGNETENQIKGEKLCFAELYKSFLGAFTMIKNNRVQFIFGALGFFIAMFIAAALLFGGVSSSVANGYAKNPLGGNTIDLHVDDVSLFTPGDFRSSILDQEEIKEVVPMEKIENVEMFGNSNVSGHFEVVATDNIFFDYAAIKFVKGRAFSAGDVSTRSMTAVISSDLANTVFGNSDPMGLEIKLNNQVYTVKGVFVGKGRYNPGCLAIIPYKSGRLLLNSTEVGTYSFVGTSDIEKNYNYVNNYVESKLKSKRLLTSDLGNKRYDIKCNTTKDNGNGFFVFGFAVYLVLLILSGFALLLFGLYPSKNDLLYEYSSIKKRKLYMYLRSEFVCLITALSGNILGCVLGVLSAILYCGISSIPTIFTFKMFGLLGLVFIMSIVYSLIIGIAPGVKSMKAVRRDML